MNSRERMLAALRRQDVDHVPCACFFSPSLTGPEHTWTGRADSLDRIVGDLGLDGYVTVGIDASWHPDVTARAWVDKRPGDRWPVLHKEIATPLGPLTAAIHVTQDLEHKGDIPLNSDWNVSRYVKPWLETMEDVERYRYVQLPPSDEAIAQARQRFPARKALAEAYGVITYASCGLGLTAALQLFGAQQAVLTSMDAPEVIARFLEIEHAATIKRAEVLADLGVDVICRNGFYETTDYWSPGQIRQFLVPHLKREIDVMRSGGAAVVYTVETGIMPILDILAELDFDAYQAIEPVLGGQDMRAVTRQLCDRHAIWGGVSGPMHIGEATPREVRQAVRDAFALFGPRGLVLSAVPSIRAHWPWRNALAMFGEWRALRSASYQ